MQTCNFEVLACTLVFPCYIPLPHHIYNSAFLSMASTSCDPVTLNQSRIVSLPRPDRTHLFLMDLTDASILYQYFNLNSAFFSIDAISCDSKLVPDSVTKWDKYTHLFLFNLSTSILYYIYFDHYYFFIATQAI